LKKYLITSPEFYTDTPQIFREKLKNQLQIHKPEFVLLRDKTTQNYKALAEVFVTLCREFEGVRCFLHQDATLAQELGADGVHLTSLQFGEITASKKRALEVIISTHTQEEVLEAQKLGADYATYSPIFHSPNKGEPKGVESLQKVVQNSQIKIFALGGIISQSQIKELEKSNCYGFASIRLFYEFF
jgi:thiamine-phosphate pyrophosphorylase